MKHHFSKVIHERGYSACVHCELPKDAYVDQPCFIIRSAVWRTLPPRELGPIPEKYRHYRSPGPRGELARLISEGVSQDDITAFFLHNGMMRGEVDMLLYDCGVFFHRPPERDDGISAERRLYLQHLSTQQD